MSCCYIIHSQNLNRYYIGACHDDLQVRIKQHNLHEYGEHRYTAKAKDWELILAIECESYSQALKIETHIKNMKSKTYILNLLKYPEIILKQKYL